MNLEKLEKLSCLKIEDSSKFKLIKSIEGVMDMLREVDSISVIKSESLDFAKTIFRSSELVENCDKTALPMENGLFLAPKVIKKD